MSSSKHNDSSSLGTREQLLNMGYNNPAVTVVLTIGAGCVLAGGVYAAFKAGQISQDTHESLPPINLFSEEYIENRFPTTTLATSESTTASSIQVDQESEPLLSQAHLNMFALGCCVLALAIASYYSRQKMQTGKSNWFHPRSRD